MNAPPVAGEERVDNWDPNLEVLPSGRNAPPPATRFVNHPGTAEKCTASCSSFDSPIIRGPDGKYLQMERYLSAFHKKVARGTEVPNKDSATASTVDVRFQESVDASPSQSRCENRGSSSTIQGVARAP